MLKKIILMTLVAAILAPLPSLAGMYVGGSIGNSWFSHDPEADDIKEISEYSTGWKLFGGFQSASILGVEGGYRDLGKVTDSAYYSKTKGWDVAAIGHLKVSVIDLFAKAGAFFYETDATLFNESDTALIWGLGAGVSLGGIGIRLEWESMEVKSPDSLTMLSLGATLGF